MAKCGVVIVAAGSGRRMGGDIPKQFLTLGGKEIIVHTVEKFEKLSQISKVALVVSGQDIERCQNLAKKYEWKKTIICQGGSERQDSVYSGLLSLDKDTDIVLIHDGVRPFIEESEILSVIAGTEKTGACVLAVPVKDTIKICSKDKTVLDTPDRSSLWAMQTPQGFDFNELRNAYESLVEGVAVTDDAMVMEKVGYTVTVTEGSYKNIKITTPEDMIFGEAILKG